MNEEERAARRVVRRVWRAKARRALVETGAFLAALLVVLSLAQVGILSLVLGGPPLDEDATWIAATTQAGKLREGGYDGSGVKVCLVDSGIDLVHPDLAHVDLLAWHDFIRGEERPYDDDGHGTAMAGLIFAQGRLSGLAPNASLIVAKALRNDGTGSSETVGKAIRFCMDPNADGRIDDGADIISLSLGAQRTPFTTNAAAQAALEAVEQGVFVVSSAGNDGREDDGDVGTPADEPLVIAVGSLNHQQEIAAFSSQGNNSPLLEERVDPDRKPEFVLPGVGLTTTARGASYTSITGTSASAALLSGLLALLLEAHPAYRRADALAIRAVKTALMQTAQPLEAQLLPHDDWYGYGLIQVYEAHLLLD